MRHLWLPFVAAIGLENTLMSIKDDCFARAAASLAEAEVAGLQNVKDRCLRSAAAWNAIATRVERTKSLRANVEAKSLAATTALAERPADKASALAVCNG